MNSFFQAVLHWSKQDKKKNALGKVKITFISIFLGLILGAVIISIMGYNPINIFKTLFTFSFQSPTKINTLLIFTAIYSLAGLANAFAFKTGLFNIGVPGQMIAGGATSMLLALTVFKTLNSAVAVPLLILIAIAIAFVVGIFVGFLKAQFNVHEVVSTILLNWIIFYLFKYLFRTTQAFVSGTGDSVLLSRRLFLGGNDTSAWVVSIVIVAVLSIIAFFVIKFTTFGKSIAMTGHNKDGAKYAGINVKMATILSLGISAAIAGMLGYVVYFAKFHFVPKLEETLPSYGFDGIAIALLAFSSPLAIPFISLFYGIFSTGAGGTALPSGIKNETISLILSVIIYFAAISNLFIMFKPYQFIKTYFKLNRNKEVSAIRQEAKKISAEIKTETEDIEMLQLKHQQLLEKLKTMKKAREKRQLKIEINKLLREIKDQKKMLTIRVKGVIQEAKIRAIEIVNHDLQYHAELNYGITHYYLKAKLIENYSFLKNNYLIENKFITKKQHLQNLKALKQKHNKQVATLKKAGAIDKNLADEVQTVKDMLAKNIMLAHKKYNTYNAELKAKINVKMHALKAQYLSTKEESLTAFKDLKRQYKENQITKDGFYKKVINLTKMKGAR